MLIIVEGTKNGLTLRGPFFTNASIFCSIKPSPPMPEPIAQPILVAFSGVISMPESWNAIKPAAIPYSISTPYDLPGFKRLLGDGSDFGVKFEYAEQPAPDGLAQAFIIGEEFIGDDSACLVLGDNIFYGQSFTRMLTEAVRTVEEEKKAVIFGYHVSDPERYGVAEFDEKGNVLSIEEKPEHPKSNYAVVGLYFYPNKVVDVAKSIKPSPRGELEITTVNQDFLADNELKVQLLGRGFAWLDTGTHDSLSEASTFIEVIEKRQGLKVACLEAIAYHQGWIDDEKLIEVAKPMLKNEYGKNLMNLLKHK